jgi:hypothetical protein
MTALAVIDVMDPQRDGADMPDVSVQRFAGRAWEIGDLDTQSFMDAVVAIERLCQVRLTEPRMVEPKPRST